MELQENVRAFLQKPLFGVLATSKRDGSVQQSVIWYELDGDEILMNTAAHRAKNKNLQRDNRASLCVMDTDGDSYVTLEGTITLNDAQEQAQADILRLAIRYDGEEQAIQESRDTFSKMQRVTMRLKIEHLIAYNIA